jgi:hypothetical protein
MARGGAAARRRRRSAGGRVPHADPRSSRLRLPSQLERKFQRPTSPPAVSVRAVRARTHTVHFHASTVRPGMSVGQLGPESARPARDRRPDVRVAPVLRSKHGSRPGLHGTTMRAQSWENARRSVAGTGTWTLQSGAKALRSDTTDLGALERTTIAKILQECRGNKTKAARRLGLSRTQLHLRIRKYRLEEVMSA